MAQPGSLAGNQLSGMNQLSAGSQVVKDLIAKLLAQAGIALGTTPGSLRGNQRVNYLQAAQGQLGVPRTMLGSLLGKMGANTQRDFRTRNAGSGVPASPQALQESFALSGGQGQYQGAPQYQAPGPTQWMNQGASSPYPSGAAPAAGPSQGPQAQPAAPPGPPPVPGAIWNGVQWVMPQNQGGTSLGGGNNNAAALAQRQLAGRSVGRY